MENTRPPLIVKALDGTNIDILARLAKEREEALQAESAASTMPQTGTTPEHIAIMAALNKNAHKTTAQAPTVYHERLQFGHEVKLDPAIEPETTINIAIEEGGKVSVYPIHADLLCYYSPYFHKMINHGLVTVKALVRSDMLYREWRWVLAADIDSMECNGCCDKDGKVQVDVRIKLPGKNEFRRIDLDKKEVGDIGDQVLRAFIDWLYKGFAGFTFDGYGHMKYHSSDIIKLWVFAGKVGIPACQNHCIEAIQLLHGQTGEINTGMLRWVYENTDGMRHNEKLKRLLIDHCTWGLPGMWILNGGLGDDLGVPREAVIHILGRVLFMAQSSVNILEAAPPFHILEWRKALYWIEDNGEEYDTA